MTGLLLHIYKVCVSFGLVEITTFFIKKKERKENCRASNYSGTQVSNLSSTQVVAKFNKSLIPQLENG